MEHKGSIHTLDRTDGSVAPRSRRRIMLFALGLAVFLLAAATIYLSLPTVESSAAPELAGETTADSARWAAIGEYYAARTAGVERGAAASVARWNAMGAHYAGKASNVDASVARWEAMAEHYAAEAADVERGAAASVARWEAMGETYSR
jgi:hypothetical protein